jgi:hypothetical protein
VRYFVPACSRPSKPVGRWPLFRHRRRMSSIYHRSAAGPHDRPAGAA